MYSNQVRQSIVAGSFYPSNPSVLRRMIIEFLEKAENKNINNIKGLVCPHAGYIYSGQIAAHSYKQIEGKDYETVIIIAPSHAEYFDFNSIYTGSAYETPLGLVKIDTEKALSLINKSNYPSYIQGSTFGHRKEHSLEVQLPFLQVVLSDFKIIPIVMGAQTKQNIESLGRAIGDLFKGENILIIASTDLSHYHSYSTAVSLDSKVIEAIEKFNDPSFDIEEFIDDISTQQLEMCGGGPVASAMIASSLLGANEAAVLEYKNSGDVSGDKSAVVGYLSAAFYQS